MDKYVLAENICKLCKEEHMSAESLAESIGKSVRQVNRYRTGQYQRLSLETLQAIANALNTDIKTLLSDTL